MILIHSNGGSHKEYQVTCQDWIFGISLELLESHENFRSLIRIFKISPKFQNIFWITGIFRNVSRICIKIQNLWSFVSKQLNDSYKIILIKNNVRKRLIFSVCRIIVRYNKEWFYNVQIFLTKKLRVGKLLVWTSNLLLLS